MSERDSINTKDRETSSDSVLYVINDVGGPKTRSSSVAQYQFSKSVCDDFNTYIISKTPIKEPSLNKMSTKSFTPPGNVYIRNILFPFFVIYVYILYRKDIRLLITGGDGSIHLPTIPISILSDSNWVIFEWDSPDWRHNRRREYEDRVNLEFMYREVMFLVSRLSYTISDQVFLSDKTELIKEGQKTTFIGGADCRKINKVESKTPPSNNRYKDMKRVVYVGNMYYHRGIDLILEAADQCGSDFQLVLIGPSPEESENENFLPQGISSFQDLLNNYDIEYEYLGVLDHEDALSEMTKSDIGICILPYERGMNDYRLSYPIKVFEYMNSGLALLCSETPAMKDVIGNNQLTQNDSTDIAKNLGRMLRDEDHLNEMKQNNKDSGPEYCWENIRPTISEELKKYMKDTDA